MAGGDGAQAHFVFLLEEGFTMQALSSAIEVLRIARKLKGAARYDYAVAAMARGPVTASNGVAVLATHEPAEAPRHATILVVSGAGIEARRNPALVAELRRLHRAGHGVWGISSGVVRLAEAGLFRPGADERRPRVAAHWEDVPHLRATFPELDLTGSLFEWGAGVASCAGGGAAADLMLEVLRRRGESDLVHEVTARLVVDGVRDGRLAQREAAELSFATSDPVVFSALRMMRETLHEPVPIGRIAARAAVSQRQLERLFRRELGTTPLAVYHELRLAAARQEVLAGRRPIIEIALDHGFSSDRFTRAYRQRYGRAPREDRLAAHDPLS